MNSLVPYITHRINTALLTPLLAFKLRYLPLLLVYFTYGASFVTNISIAFWIKEKLSFTAVQIASVTIWAGVPWIIKMVFGQFLDNVAIFGSRRKAYVFAGAGLIATGTFLLASLAGGYTWIASVDNTFGVYLFACILISTGYAVQDTAADTMTAEVVARTEKVPDQNITGGFRISARPEEAIKKDLAMVQVLGRLSLSFGLVAVANLGGFLADKARAGITMTYESVFWLSLILPVISCIGVSFVRLEQDDRRFEKEKRRFDPALLTGGIILGIASACLGVAKITMEGRLAVLKFADEIIFIFSLFIIIWMLKRLTKTFPKDSLKIFVRTMAVIFIFRLNPTVGEGLKWWMIDILRFDPSFFGKLDLVGAIMPLLVLWFCSDLIYRKSLRSVVIFLIIGYTVMSLPELFLYYGGPAIQNKAKIIMTGDTALERPLAQIALIPLLAFIAYHAPAGNRGTWFAVGTSFMNVALMGNRLLTKYLNEIFVITRQVVDQTTGEVVTQADYSQLGMLLITRICIISILPMMAVLLLLPKERKQSQN
jgi:hypothetical protein